MQCPVCDEKLRTIEKFGVEIDVCPGCKGIWLDRGELDKVLELEKAGGPVSEAPRPAERERPRGDDDHHGHDDDRERGHDEDHGHDGERGRYSGERGEVPSRDERGAPRKRGSWVSDLLGGFMEGGGD